MRAICHLWKPLLFMLLLSSRALGDEYTAKPTPGGKEGTEKVDQPDVNGGRVKVKTGVDFSTHYSKREKDNPYKNGISMSYDGKCNPWCWLQFTWREHLVTENGKLTPTKGDYDIPQHKADGSPGGEVKTGHFETDPKPTPLVDSASVANPCYDSEAAHSPDHTTIYDAPNVKDTHWVKNGKPEEIRIHFSTYIICDKKVIYRIKWTCTYKQPGGDEVVAHPTAEYEVEGKPVDKIEPEEKTQLGKDAEKVF